MKNILVTGGAGFIGSNYINHIMMKRGCKEYPNTGVKIDPRSITSARTPESLKVYNGFLNRASYFLMVNGSLNPS